MQKFNELSKWQRLAAGEVATFASSAVRRVRLDINSPGHAEMTIEQDGAAFVFHVHGREVVEFVAEGPFALHSSEDVWIYTADGKDWSVQPVDDTTFTKIVERRERNPQVEYMMALANENMERRLAEQARSYDALLAARDARAEQRAAALERAAAERASATGVGDGGETGGPASPAAQSPGAPGASDTEADGDGGKK